MEIIGALLGVFFALVSPSEITAKTGPYVLVHEYQTSQECQEAIKDTKDICLESKHYSSSGPMVVVDRSLTIEPNAVSGIDSGECKHISGCAVDPDAKTEEEYCPTCTKSKWYEVIEPRYW